MSVAARNLLADVADAYVESRNRYERHMARGEREAADDYLTEMQEMEADIRVNVISMRWRRTIEARRQREREAARR